MELKDYTFEEIEAEYKKRITERMTAKLAEAAKIKRCRTCVFYGTVDSYGRPQEPNKTITNIDFKFHYCPFMTMKQGSFGGRTHKIVVPSTKACDRYRQK